MVAIHITMVLYKPFSMLSRAHVPHILQGCYISWTGQWHNLQHRQDWSSHDDSIEKPSNLSEGRSPVTGSFPTQSDSN